MFRLAHLSDPHLPPPTASVGLREIVSKRTLSRLAWRRKHHQHDPAVLAALVADIAAQAPDHIAVTGDLTNFSSPGEFAAARAWLQGLGPTAEITVSPGNHDALVADGHAERFASLAPWLGDTGQTVFPQIRRRGPVAIVNLCSAIPTPPLFASGRLGDDQLAGLDEALATLGAEGRFRIVMVHHPLLRGVVSRRKALEDAAAMRAVLLRRGAELVLHGHAHEAVFGAVPGPRGPIPVLGVPSASSPLGQHHQAARWHGIEIAQDGAVTVVARGLDPATDVIGELGRYGLAALTSGIAA